MATYGNIASAAAAGGPSSIDTGNLNVTGANLALVCGFAETDSSDITATFAWDVATANEAMTGQFAAIASGNYIEVEMEYLDNPTAVNSVVTASLSGTTVDAAVFAVFATDADDIVGTDVATDNFTTNGTSVSSTVPNAVATDLLVDVFAISQQFTMTEGADQTNRVEVDSVTFLRMGVSTQDGADGGVMSWTCTDPIFGGGHIGVRIPGFGAAGTSPEFIINKRRFQGTRPRYENLLEH